MPKYTGEDLAVSIGGTPLTNVKSATVNETVETYEDSACGDEDTEYLGGIKDATFSVECWDDGSNFAALAPSKTAKAIVVYPEGNTAGKLSRSFNAIINNRSQGITHKAVTPLTAAGQISGGITDAAVSGGGGGE